MIPIGSKVRWKDQYRSSPWVGVVTGHEGIFCEVDGKSKISVGLLAVVEEPSAAAGDDVKALMAEIEGLQALVADQCEAMAEMAPVEPWHRWVDKATDLLRDYLFVLTGSAAPVRRVEPAELQALLDHLTDGGP